LFIAKNKPVWGTCAGMILLSNEIIGKIENQRHIGGLDVIIERNFFGSQQQSFIKNIEYPKEFNKEGEYPAIFIRAPQVFLKVQTLKNELEQLFKLLHIIMMQK
jgi:5'-phosphate synthase pdxT subunit